MFIFVIKRLLLSILIVQIYYIVAVQTAKMQDLQKTPTIFTKLYLPLDNDFTNILFY